MVLKKMVSSYLKWVKVFHKYFEEKKVQLYHLRSHWDLKKKLQSCDQNKLWYDALFMHH